MAYIYDDSGEHETLPSADVVLARIDRWKERLQALYRQIEGWLPPGFEARRVAGSLWRSPLMKAVGIGHVRLDDLLIERCGERVLKVTPRSLWMIGGNGSVNIWRPNEEFVKLVDAGTDDTPQWTLYPSRDPFQRYPFTRDELLILLRSNA